MEYTLDTSHERYIKISVNGLIVKSELVKLMAEILKHPLYPDRHTFWDLRHASLGLSISDLKEIVGVLRLYNPPVKRFSGKAALLVPGKMNTAIAEIFVAMTDFFQSNTRCLTRRTP